MGAAILRLAENPSADPNQASKWLDLYERLEDRRRKQAYTEALARIQAAMPQIERHGVISLKHSEIKYAKLEDIDETIRPMLAIEGFSFSFGSHSDDGKLFEISAKLSHREGHSEVFHVHMPLDPGPQTGAYRRSPVQAVASTLTFARRQLIIMALHIVVRDEDKDGADLERISEDQLRDLHGLMTEVAADETRFLRFIGVERLEDILVRDFDKAISQLERKRK